MSTGLREKSSSSGTWHLRDANGVVWNHHDFSTLINFVARRNRINGASPTDSTPWKETHREFGHRADHRLGSRI